MSTNIDNETETGSSLTDTIDKRKRVNRIKNGIIIAIFVSIIVSFLAIIGLIISIVNIVSLNHRIKALERYDNTSNTSLVVNADDMSNIISPGSDETSNVYLTFDDGPSGNTSEILDILARYDVKATFFLVGKDDEESTQLIKRMSDEGHSIGMHSYSNKYSLVYSSIDTFTDDVNSISNYIGGIIGHRPTLYRFPGGSANKVTNVDMRECIDYLDSQGITYYDWNVSSGDSASSAYTSNELVENVMRDVLKYKTSIVLMHDADNLDNTVEALPMLIEELQANNASIMPITKDTPLVQHVTVR